MLKKTNFFSDLSLPQGRSDVTNIFYRCQSLSMQIRFVQTAQSRKKKDFFPMANSYIEEKNANFSSEESKLPSMPQKQQQQQKNCYLMFHLKKC